MGPKSSSDSPHAGSFSLSQAAALGSTRLEALLESAQLLHSSQGLEDLLRHLLRTVMGRLLAGRGFVAILESGTMRISLARGMRRLKAGDPFDEETARSEGVESLFPIGNPDQPAGLLGVARPPGKEIEPAEQEFVRALLGIAASGITKALAHAETHRLNIVLGQKLQDLRTLLDLARGLSGCLDPNQVAQLLGLTLAGRWAVRKYAIAAWREDHPLVLRQKGMELPGPEIIREAAANLPESGRVADIPPGIFRSALESQEASLLFPLRSSENTIGLVAVGPRPGKNAYADADLDFGAGMAAQAVVAFENAWYFLETVHKKRMEQELALAASIQAKLFPSSLPEIPHYSLAARNRPAYECGGDYYDMMPMAAEGETRPYLMCLADVSGKGIPAALLMSNMQATLRASLEYRPDLVDLALHTNALLYDTTPGDKYITSILIRIHPQSGACRYVNAGHHGAILLRADGTAEDLGPTGPPLGLLRGLPYEAQDLEIRTGDTLVLFSDGVPEAFDENDEEWGDERLLDCLRECASLSPADLIAKVVEAIDAFAGKAPQHDDITLLVIKRDC